MKPEERRAGNMEEKELKLTQTTRGAG